MRNFGKFVTVAITAVLLEGVVTTTCVNCSVNGAQKKAAKKVVVFKDGKAITEAEINEGIQELPEEMSNRMTMGQLRLLETLLLAYREVTERVAKGTKLNNEDEGQVKRRIDNIAANEYIRRMVATRMTPAALEKHYDKTYKEKIEGQKAADVRIIILKNKSEIEAFDPVVKANGSAAAVEAYCAKHPANVAATLKNRLLATLPPEVAKIASTKGGKHLVGPFKVRGVMMYFYVDDVCDARKEKFTEALARAYSRGAELDFTRDFYAELFKQYDAKVCGLDKKDFNPNDFKPEVLGKNATDKSEAAVLKLGDAHVLAKYKGGIVTAKDVKEYYTTPSLGSDVLIGMRSRYGMSLWDVIVYAVRVILEERIAALECKKAKFDQEPEIMRIIARERNDETLHVVLSKLKVDEKAVQRAFEDLMKTVDRDDHEVSARAVMYDTKEESESSLRQVTSGAKKFSDLYARSADRDKMELKNVTKQSVNPVVWGALKGTPAAACCKTAIEIETEDGNTRWAVLHIMNRKRIPLPSLKDPAVRRRCANAAQQQIAVTHVINLMLQHVETMSDQPAKVMLDMPTTKDILTYIISSPRL